MDGLEIEILSVVMDRVNFLRLGIDAAGLVAEDGTLFPALFPKRVD